MEEAVLPCDEDQEALPCEEDAAAVDHAAPPRQEEEAPAADAEEREMRDLEDLLAKLNTMAEEFVPPSLASPVAAAGPGAGPAPLTPTPLSPAASELQGPRARTPMADAREPRGRTTMHTTVHKPTLSRMEMQSRPVTPLFCTIDTWLIWNLTGGVASAVVQKQMECPN